MLHFVLHNNPVTTMHPRSKRTFPASRMSTLLFTTLSTVALQLTSFHHHVEALKLTSLGSTLESNGNAESNNPLNRGDALLSDVDYSNLACSSPDGGDASSSSSSSSSSSLATCSSTYGVDRSFPVQHGASALTAVEGWPDKKIMYKEFMEGCHEKYETYLCDGSEIERMEMNLRQPAGMYNYTTLGFHKVRAPTTITNLLTKFWNKQTKQHHHSSSSSITNIPNETWDPGNTYTNHWSSPTKMLNIDSSLRKIIWDASQPLLEEWTGRQLTPSSLYGVRVYAEGAVLAPHVDRTPLVISAIVNVDQDVDEPWPLEVYGHDGNAYNITMEVGDMVFYESHTVIHGRPFPLVGRHYANVFIHFEPLGHSLQREEEEGRNGEDGEESLEYLYQQAWKNLQSKCQDDEECSRREDLNVGNRVPHYIIPGSEEERRWLQTHPKARLDTSKDNEWVKSLSAHTAASTGDLEALIAIAIDNPDALKHKDNNGWNPLHEAVRGGHVEIVKFLLKGGLDKNERTHTGNGGSPLWWAKKTHGTDHAMVKYLESIGAVETPPQGHKMIE
mmetsp:Transcript_30398/g.65643  ORF Transcript_30398/g.65643 Transcript_30398/m.65643 type:complete len:559 (+) Transcript_30398:70-1746(+)